MRKLRYGLILALVCLLAVILSASAETYVEQGGYIPDQNTYRGSWQSAYWQILANHAGPVLQYQQRSIAFSLNGRDFMVPCRPVGIEDLNFDGIPELIFMEAASAGSRGDLYIYTADASGAHCALYVPGITRLDYDELLGFHIYMSNVGENALVIEHYKYEAPWVLQFGYDGYRYSLRHSMTIDADHSGMGYDTFYRDGMVVPDYEYEGALNALRNGNYRVISAYFDKGYTSYGFGSTYEAALQSLGGTPAPAPAPEPQPVYGLTIDKLSTRTGPGTTYSEGGTYSVKGQYIQVLAKAYDRRNGIWWVKCVIPYRGENRILWTGYKRFDPATLSLDQLPEETW